MIGKKLTDITKEDLAALIDNAVIEGKTIEYKSQLNLDLDQDKKEFLADVSSFANTNGGDLIFGIDEKKGIPVKVTGIDVENVDTLKARIDGIVRSGISPQINFDIHVVVLEDKKVVVILRIDDSWNKPHRIEFKQIHRFHARSSSGKYTLDVQELKELFVQSANLSKRIDEFRIERILKVRTGGVYPEGFPTYVLHVIPLASFGLNQDFGVNFTNDEDRLFVPIIIGGYKIDAGINLEGLYRRYLDENGQLEASCQYHRNGIIEAIQIGLREDMEKKIISTSFIEENVMSATHRYLNLLSNLGVEGPVLICLDLINIRGFRTTTTGFQSAFDHRVLDRDQISLTPLLIDGVQLYADQDSFCRTMKPLFDQMWNAFGRFSSPYYDDNGKWHRPRY